MNALTLYMLLDVSDIEQLAALRTWHAAMPAWTRSEARAELVGGIRRER